MFCDNCACHLGEIIELFREECDAGLFPRNLSETELLSQNNNEQEIVEKYLNDGYDYNMINNFSKAEQNQCKFENFETTTASIWIKQESKCF